MTDVVYKNGKILKQGDVGYVKDIPQYATNLWKKTII